MIEKTKNQKLDAVLGRALRDREFWNRLTTNPKAVAMEEGLAAEELEVIAGGVAITNPGTIMYCTSKTCNEKGGARNINPGDLVINPGNIAAKP